LVVKILGEGNQSSKTVGCKDIGEGNQSSKTVGCKDIGGRKSEFENSAF